MANTPRHGHDDRTRDTMEKAKDVASNVSEKTRTAADQAKDTASNLTQQAQHAMQRAGDVASDVGQRAGEAVSSVGGQIRNLASTIRQNVPGEGTMGSAAAAIADTLESGGNYLEGQDLSAMAEDLAGVIRRYPVASVMAGVGVGFLLGCTLRR